MIMASVTLVSTKKPSAVGVVVVEGRGGGAIVLCCSEHRTR